MASDCVPTIRDLLANPRLGLITGAELAHLIREGQRPTHPSATCTRRFRRSLARAAEDGRLMAQHELALRGAAGAFLGAADWDAYDEVVSRWEPSAQPHGAAGGVVIASHVADPPAAVEPLPRAASSPTTAAGGTDLPAAAGPSGEVA